QNRRDLPRDIPLDSVEVLSDVNVDYLHDEENVDEEEEDEFTKELYDDVNLNLGNEDTKMTNADQDVATLVIEKNVTESLEATVLTRSSSQPQSLYEAASTLSEFKLTKILIDNIEKNKSFNVADNKRELYDALIKCYNTDKDIVGSYGEVFSLKRCQDERDKDRDLFAGSYRGTKRRKSSKDVESSIDSKSKEKKSSSKQHDQEFVTGDNDEQLADKEVTKADWFKKTERPPTLDLDWSKKRQIDFQPPQTCISQVADVEEPPTSFNELNDTSFDFSAFVINWLIITILKNVLKQQLNDLTVITSKTNYLEYLNGRDLSRKYSTSMTKRKAVTYELKWIEDLGPKRQSFYGYASNLTSSKDVYFRRRIIMVTRLKIMKKYDYGHLEEIEVRRDDQELYTFKEGDFKRLCLQDIEDMNRRKRLMRTDERHKFSDGTLNDVRSALYDISVRIRMEYLPMRKWSNLDKKRARVMVQDIDKQFYQRRLMRNLEKFVGGRVYGNDLRLLEGQYDSVISCLNSFQGTTAHGGLGRIVWYYSGGLGCTVEAVWERGKKGEKMVWVLFGFVMGFRIWKKEPLGFVGVGSWI
nr:hypothetical protein [Tanacetum cinerariifolium]